MSKHCFECSPDFDCWGNHARCRKPGCELAPVYRPGNSCGDPIVDAVRAKLCNHGDELCEAVAQKLASRSRVGQAKYGTKLTRTDLTKKDWLRHIQEEAMDMANYCEVLIQGTPLLTRFSDLQEQALAAAVEIESYMRELSDEQP